MGLLAKEKGSQQCVRGPEAMATSNTVLAVPAAAVAAEACMAECAPQKKVRMTSARNKLTSWSANVRSVGYGTRRWSLASVRQARPHWRPHPVPVQMKEG